MTEPVYPIRRYLNAHPEDSQTSLAARVPMSVQKLNDLIAGRWRRPSPELALQLSTAMYGEVSVLELLFCRTAPPKRARVGCVNGSPRMRVATFRRQQQHRAVQR